jgi:DNA helicase-2/ATP-dependent DNA helicase PcrA
LKQLINAANIDEKRWPARLLAGLIDGWKNRAWTPEKVPSSEASAYNNRGTELYAAYQDRLLTLNATDFGDLLLHCVTIFQTRPDVLQQYQRWFRYILVDEYQDTNVAQYLWLRLLAQAHKNICCVGDDDQSIYGWRGAEVGNILRFEKDFPGAQVIRLEQNYRSTGHILAAPRGIIAKNAGRLGKTLWTAGALGREGPAYRPLGRRGRGALDRRGDRGDPAGHPRVRSGGPEPSGDPRPRLPPDAGLRGPLPDHRPALSRDRRAKVL